MPSRENPAGVTDRDEIERRIAAAMKASAGASRKPRAKAARERARA
jgi:hypothetical protein